MRKQPSLAEVIKTWETADLIEWVASYKEQIADLQREGEDASRWIAFVTAYEAELARRK